MAEAAVDEGRYHCAVELSLSVIGGKWAVVVLAHLKEGVHRYGELRRRIPGVSEKVLVQRLRSLEAAGLVSRHSDGAVPPAVEYRLTAEGESLAPVLTALHAWGEQRARRTGALIVPATEDRRPGRAGSTVRQRSSSARPTTMPSGPRT